MDASDYNTDTDTSDTDTTNEMSNLMCQGGKTTHKENNHTNTENMKMTIKAATKVQHEMLINIVFTRSQRGVNGIG